MYPMKNMKYPAVSGLMGSSSYQKVGYAAGMSKDLSCNTRSMANIESGVFRFSGEYSWIKYATIVPAMCSASVKFCFSGAGKEAEWQGDIQFPCSEPPVEIQVSCVESEKGIGCDLVEL